MATLFKHITNTGQFPSADVLIYQKKKNILDLTSYIPISLLNTVGKCYARYLYLILVVWMQNENIIIEEQARFREKLSMIDYCLVLQKKYSAPCHASLCAAFVDFVSTLNLISK